LGGRAGAAEHAVVDPAAVLEDLRMVMESAFREQGAVLEWNIEEPLPAVRGDHHPLLRVFMNLSQNSLRAMENTERKQLTISAQPARASRVDVRFRDTGPGVAHPERIFRPFQPEAQGTGLGLYVSRALVRSLGGDLNYEPQPDGALFTVELMGSE
jgi:C4-dicarboxylate-specific signal transduction histidine kinase